MAMAIHAWSWRRKKSSAEQHDVKSISAQASLDETQAALSASSQVEKERDSGDVTVDERKASAKGEYTVEQAAKPAEREAEEGGEVSESFMEKTRRAIEEAWAANKDTAEEIKEGVKRQTSDG